MDDFLNFYLDHCPSCQVYLGDEVKRGGECYDCGVVISMKQRGFAQKNSEVYCQEVEFTPGVFKKVIELAEYHEFESAIQKVFGVFAVTDYGIECLTHTYQIERLRLNEIDWVEHMGEKQWVNVDDFRAALAYAKASLRR